MKIRKFSIRESLCAQNVQFAHSRKYMRAKVYARESLCARKFMRAKVYARESLCARKFMRAKVYARESICARKYMRAKVYARESFFTPGIDNYFFRYGDQDERIKLCVCVWVCACVGGGGGGGVHSLKCFKNYYQFSDVVVSHYFEKIALISYSFISRVRAMTNFIWLHQ